MNKFIKILSIFLVILLLALVIYKTFNIEKKNGTKYRVAVRDNSTSVLAWYEVDTQNWKVSEY